MKLSTTSLAPHRIILHIEGRLDAETCNTLKRAFHDHSVNGVKFITVEMSQVQFVDSSGLSALISGLKVMRQTNGALNLAAPGTQARSALRLTMLDTVLPVFETVEEAVAAHSA